MVYSFESQCTWGTGVKRTRALAQNSLLLALGQFANLIVKPWLSKEGVVWQTKTYVCDLQ